VLAQLDFCLGDIAGGDLIFQWIGMMEYIPCYSAPAERWGPLSVLRPASRKILIEQKYQKADRASTLQYITS
jgi:hypothetical protein